MTRRQVKNRGFASMSRERNAELARRARAGEIDFSRATTFNLDELERLVHARTKLIVINSPHNPTGAMLAQSDLERLAEIAGRVDAWVLSDEAYRWLDHPGGADHRSVVGPPGPGHRAGDRGRRRSPSATGTRRSLGHPSTCAMSSSSLGGTTPGV